MGDAGTAVRRVPQPRVDRTDPAVNGCIINIRVSRIPVAKQASGWIASGPEQELLEGACMQFPSHASGDVVFGPDGYLYASAGDGASFDTEDWGQAGNPCGDPANEGGSLRSQDIRTVRRPAQRQRRDLPDQQGQRQRAQRLDQQRGPDRRPTASATRGG